MDNKENKTPKPQKALSAKDKQKRGIIIAFCAMIAVVFVWYAVVPAVSYVADLIKESQKEKYTSDYMDHIKSLSFYPANYSEDITKDSEYMDKNRYIAYTKGSDTYYITSDDYSMYDPTVEFFVDYFDTVINGRYEEYDSYFTDTYFEEQSNKERFTPQKLYDIVIKYKSVSAVEGATSYIYHVDYKIFKNNGTFRNDIESDATRTLVYELYLYEDGKILINYIGR